MKAKFEATDPEEMEFTMTVTMTLHEWQQLRVQCKNDYPGFRLSSVISDMVVQANQAYWPNENRTDP
jgi:hypothetical protein